MTDKQKNFVVRTITAVFFVAALVTCFLRPVSMVFLFTIITGMTIWEFTGLVNNNIAATQVNRFITTAAGVFLFLAMAAFCSGQETAVVFIPYLLTIIYLFVSELYTGNENPVSDWAYTMMAQLYIALPFSTLNILAFQNADGVTVYSAIPPLAVYIFLWINDAGAYCTGSLLGKHKLFPRISPGKSWEGSIGGGILVMLVAAIGGYILEDGNTLAAARWAGLGLIVVFFGTWGDLVESLIKRTIGIKDSGNILPGHGGMLDRFDSSLLAIPATVVYLYALQYFM